MIILDTDHVTLMQLAVDEGERIRNRLRVLGLSDSPPTTIVTYEEQVRGWISKLSLSKSVMDEVRLYRKLSEQLIYYGSLHVVEFSEKAAVEFQRLRGLKVRIGTMDLKIAAIALAHDATL